jgi:hypothetical protein
MKMFFIAALAAFGLFASNGSAEGARGCATGSIRGTYGLAGTGISSQGGQTLQYALLGRIEFSGSGAVSGTQSINIAGQVLRGPVTGSYQVRSDCSGTLTLLVPGGSTTFDILILKGENEILLIETVPGEIAAGSLKKM